MNELPPLSSYPDEYLAAFSPSRLTDILINDEDRVPRNVIDESARRGDAMVEQLSRLIEGKQEWIGKLPGRVVAETARHHDSRPDPKRTRRAIAD